MVTKFYITMKTNGLSVKNKQTKKQMPLFFFFTNATLIDRKTHHLLCAIFKSLPYNLLLFFYTLCMCVCIGTHTFLNRQENIYLSKRSFLQKLYRIQLKSRIKKKSLWHED